MPTPSINIVYLHSYDTGRYVAPMGHDVETPYVLREEVFAEVNYHAAYDPARAVRTNRWKYIRHYDAEMTTPVLPNCDDSEAKSVWLEHGWAQRAIDQERLYDLVFDPNETNNLAMDPTHAPILAQMRSRLLTWMEATADPLLSGAVAAPAGSRINDKRGASPRDEPDLVE
jgi:arylsulfatase A-like enzyme